MKISPMVMEKCSASSYPARLNNVKKKPESILKNIRADLGRSGDPTAIEVFKRFFKETPVFYGVKSATVSAIAKKYWKEIAQWDKEEIFKLCESLYRSDFCEEAFIAAKWLPKLSGSFVRKDLTTFKNWISSYINNWAKCDGFCNHTMGDYFEKFPEDIKELKKWTQSDNRWLKRAAAVSLIVPAKRGKFLVDVFDIAERLLKDEDDMAQKGYGWLLKEASRLHQKEVFDFVNTNKRDMPRTALRYAIELMPKNLKAEAMKKP
jgi:3-methyladenine DNA glycosylase AlkD